MRVFCRTQTCGELLWAHGYDLSFPDWVDQSVSLILFLFCSLPVAMSVVCLIFGLVVVIWFEKLYKDLDLFGFGGFFTLW